ncbi:PPE family protein [Nocardia sp. CC201C]|uniref:PPE family protein n=1 Tax=Nocardia sp. CC201C TaxID=3044575 RepID=UPI0024A94F95|nr:PPE family protein [Nocardia sp. CC201C]
MFPLLLFPLGLDFAALPPEVNSARLSTGPGPGPMTATAAGYSGIAAALSGTAASSDGSMNAMSASWQGPSATSATSAFRAHANWLRQQAQVAEAASAHATGVGEAYTAALSSMPPLPLILANRAASAALTAVASTGGPLATATAPLLAANEAMYMAMWVAAAASMYGYAGQTMAHLAALPPPLPAPPIVAGGGPAPTLPGGSSNYVAPQTGGSPPVTSSTAVTGSGGAGGSGGGGGGSGGGGSSGGGSGGGGDAGGSMPDPTQPIGDPGQPGSEIQNGISDVERAISSMSDPGLAEFPGDPLAHMGFPGTSMESTTLAGLNGGAGSMVALGLVRGGLGAMSGASTGFRMPPSWPAGVGTAFGAAPATTSSAPVARGAPRRGVSAPTARMRRRREDEKQRKPKVFIPGAPVDVPVLERPLNIGVIETSSSDFDADREPDREVNFSIGVIGAVDDERDGVVPSASKHPR